MKDNEKETFPRVELVWKTQKETYYIKNGEVLTEFTVTETYKVKARTEQQAMHAICSDDFSEVELITEDREIILQPNF